MIASRRLSGDQTAPDVLCSGQLLDGVGADRANPESALAVRGLGRERDRPPSGEITGVPTIPGNEISKRIGGAGGESGAEISAAGTRQRPARRHEPR